MTYRKRNTLIFSGFHDAILDEIALTKSENDLQVDITVKNSLHLNNGDSVTVVMPIRDIRRFLYSRKKRKTKQKDNGTIS